MLPYFCFGIIITLFELYLHPFSEIWENVSTRLFNYGAMWFIPVLFVTELLFYPISKINHKYVKILILIISAITGWALYYFSISFPLSLSTCFAALFFYGLGFLNKERINAMLSLSKTYFFFVVFVCHIILIFMSNTTIGMLENHIPQPIFNYATAIAGLLSFCILCNLLIKLAKICKVNIVLPMIYIGQNTLIILCFHMLFIGYAVKLIMPYINNHILYKGVEFLFIWALCFVMIFVIRKYFPWMINKQKINEK
jgi:fucose 4-O-acetylase-like acetyltransferase